VIHNSSFSLVRLAPLLVATTLLAAPIAVGIGYLVLGASGAAGNAAPADLGRVLSDPQVLRSILLSLWIASVGTGLALAIALLIAVLADGVAVLDRLTRTIALLPLPVPTVAAAVAMLLLFSQSGWLSRVSTLLHLAQQPADFPALVYDPIAFGVIAAVVWKEVPFLLLVALSLQSLRGNRLADAARTLGATRWRTVRTVTLPLLLRGLAPSVIAVFVFVFGSLELPMVLGPSSPLALPMLIQERRQALNIGAHGEAYAIALLATLIAACAVAVHEWLRTDDTI
jgi:putative spermidine/putrescine transport system permease protein